MPCLPKAEPLISLEIEKGRNFPQFLAIFAFSLKICVVLVLCVLPK